MQGDGKSNTLVHCLYTRRRPLTRGSAHLNLWVEPFELDSGVGGGELPIDSNLGLIASVHPRDNGFLQRRDCGNSTG